MTAWTPDKIAYLRQWWKNGKSASEIAAHIGMSRNSVVGKAQRLGLGDTRPPRECKVWTPRRVAVLRRDWPTKSASQIGEALGLSRSSVTSKARKLGLKKRSPADPARKPANRRKSAATMVLLSNAARRNAANEATQHTTGITPGFQAPVARRCQWLHGEPTNRNFCGAPVRPGASYCEEHFARCYVAPEDRRAAKQRRTRKPGRLSSGMPT